MKARKIVFLTGTRADFGKMKSLISITQSRTEFDVHVFVTGMHMSSLYGSTVDEVEKSGFRNIYKYINQDRDAFMDRTLAKTIEGFSQFVSEVAPDLIVVHGDRVEALAGSIVGSLNNVLVAHIEGGELSGTIDELIRHAVSKMSHIHFVANEEARNRLIQLGELEESIFIIGSPDLDAMLSDKLPSIDQVKVHYEVEFSKYAIAIYHSVTTEVKDSELNAKNFVDALIKSRGQYVVIYPNNDPGSSEIIREYERLKGNKNFKVFPSVRFENFLVLMKHAEFVIGNSSAGIREAPYYNIPTVDIGSRQRNRNRNHSIINVGHSTKNILEGINAVATVNNSSRNENGFKHFGHGNSDVKFLECLKLERLYNINHQKQFQDLKL